MKVHEYQARELLAGAGIPVPQGHMVQTVDDAVSRTREMLDSGATLVVIKAQVHAGGRGKAGFVKLVKSADEARDAAKFMLSNRMVSPQTGEDGLDVKRLLVERPALTGLAVPGMPLGSPGMEHPDPRRHERYAVLGFGPDGVGVFARHEP